jgi:hypothetical protein
MEMKMKTTKRQPARATTNLDEFYTRYSAVLEAVASRVHALVGRGQKYSSTYDLARWIAHDLPTLYRQTFGSTPKPLRIWRVKTMLSNANYLGAYDALDIKTVRGKGVTTEVKPRTRGKAKLRVIRGGKR